MDVYYALGSGPDADQDLYDADQERIDEYMREQAWEDYMADLRNGYEPMI